MSSKQFDLSFQDVRSLTQLQVNVLVKRKLTENRYLKAVLIKAVESVDSMDRLSIPDPFGFLQDKQRIFNPLAYVETNFTAEDIPYLFFNTKMDVKENRYMTSFQQSFENAMRLPFYKHLQKHDLFLREFYLKDKNNKLSTCYDEHGVFRMSFFVLANLKGLFRALKLNLKNSKFDSFSLYEQNKEKYTTPNSVTSSWTVKNREAVRTKELIVLLTHLISQIDNVWEIDEREFGHFQTEHEELFYYTDDILPLTYIASSFMTTIQGSRFNCVWDWTVNSPWQWY